MIKEFATLIFIIALFSNFESDDEMGEEAVMRAARAQSLEVVIQFYELIDSQNITSYQKLFAEDCQIFFGSAKDPKTFKDVIPFVQEHYKAFPDYQHIVEALHADGEFVTVRVRYTGTHKQDFFDIKRTGLKVDYKGLFVFQVKKRKIVKVWAIEDDLGLRKQLKSNILSISKN